MEVVGEEVLGRADDNFGDSNDVDVLQLGNLGQHLGDLAKVAHVDSTIVDCIGEGLSSNIAFNTSLFYHQHS